MRFATDTGGTFTDLVVEQDDGLVTMYKAATTAEDPVQGVLDVLAVAARARDVDLRSFLGRGEMFIHGTTHAINAIITGRAARTALLVTAGHRDMLVFREGGRLEPFNNTIAYPPPYAPRELTFEIPERVIYSGAVLEPLDEQAVREVLARLPALGVEAVAVCLLWSTVNPAHERRLGELIEECLPGVPYSLSHLINPTLREFRRASSTAIDASLKPIMARYLAGLSERLASAGFAGRVMVLTSGGGMLDAAELAATPIRVINSGPSMAPNAGRYYAQREGKFRTAIVADTGGTTCDISLVRDGEIPMTRELWIGQPFRGHLAGYPSVDVKSIGAGGGSIAHVDSAGLLHVGPQSAGSAPGPACYGRGGLEPTVTDAAVVLGYIDAQFFLGGAMPLDREAAWRAVESGVARPLGVSVEEAAWNIVNLMTENMVQAIADITVSQGIDPAEAALIGGGGAAGVNSIFIARRLGCRMLILPESGAALSAAGAMMSELGAEYAASVFTTTGDFQRQRINSTLADLRSQCEDFARRFASRTQQTQTSFIAEARYENQVWEIDTPLGFSEFSTDASVAAFREAFDAMHERIFAVRDPRSNVELVGLRAQVRSRVRAADEFRLAQASIAGECSTPKVRSVYFPSGGWVGAQVHRLEMLRLHESYPGPAILESPFTSIVVDPEARFRRSAAGSILIEVCGA
jgi:N-methylhydantoinase A